MQETDCFSLVYWAPSLEGRGGFSACFDDAVPVAMGRILET
jgi:hypothetical protein